MGLQIVLANAIDIGGGAVTDVSVPPSVVPRKTNRDWFGHEDPVVGCSQDGETSVADAPLNPVLRRVRCVALNLAYSMSVCLILRLILAHRRLI